jgi:ABC-type nitrate/sulfonate/bicarbonate transport system permease component
VNSVREKTLRRVLEWTGILLLPAVWLLVTQTSLVDPTFLPPPSDVLNAAKELLASNELQTHFLTSITRIALGFFLGCVFGTVLGLACGQFRVISDIFEPLFDILRQISPVAWIPLAIIWLGFGEPSKVFIVFLGCFFATWVNVLDGVRSVDQNLVLAGSSLGARRWNTFLKILLPATLPAFFTGITIGLGNSIRFVVAAELTGAQSGLGFMMMQARESLRTDIILVGMIVMAVFGALAVWLLERVRTRVLRWHAGTNG